VGGIQKLPDRRGKNTTSAAPQHAPGEPITVASPWLWLCEQTNGDIDSYHGRRWLQVQHLIKAGTKPDLVLLCVAGQRGYKHYQPTGTTAIHSRECGHTAHVSSQPPV
jgi:hypothetical protein